MSSRTRRDAQSGVIGLTDVILGIGVAAIALPALLSAVNQQTREAQDQVAAQQLKAIGEVVPAYVKDHFVAIYQGIGSGGGDFLTVSALINTGYLPVNFNQKNGFKQTHVILLRRLAEDSGACGVLPAPQPACKRLLEATVVTTGGTVLDPAHASHIAVLAGAHAGIIVDGSTARGTYGSWCVDLNLFRSSPSAATSCPATDPRPSNSDALSYANYGYAQPAAGGLALALFFNGGVLLSEYVDRFNTGNPEDNTMHTDFNLGGNNLVGATTVQIAGVTQALDAARMGMINDLYRGSYTANSGNLNAQALTASGNVTANQIFSGDFFHTSDASLKTNVRPIGDPVPLVEQLRGHRFEWKDDGRSDVGFVAQEVQAVLPEAVGQGPNGKLTVKYDVLTAPLVEAVKSLSHRIAEIEVEVLRDQKSKERWTRRVPEQRSTEDRE